MRRIDLPPALQSLGHFPENFAIYNEGFTILGITSIAPQQTADWLSFDPPAPFSLDPGRMQVVDVIVDFDTAPAGTTVIGVNIESNDPDESPWPGGISLTVINSGSKPEIIMKDGFEEIVSPP
jgi:hypothetical protein